MPEVLFFIALLVGLMGVIGKATRKKQERTASPPGNPPVPPMLESSPAIRRYPPQRVPPVVKLSPPGAETRKTVLQGAQPAGRRGGRGGSVRDHLGRIFREEEQLLAAFIFHEILGPPQSLRRSRGRPG